jgi:hypothetical protein
VIYVLPVDPLCPASVVLKSPKLNTLGSLVCFHCVALEICMGYALLLQYCAAFYIIPLGWWNKKSMKWSGYILVWRNHKIYQQFCLESSKGSDHLGGSVLEGNNIKIDCRINSLLKCYMDWTSYRYLYWWVFLCKWKHPGFMRAGNYWPMD